MRTLYDSIDVTRIPAGAAMVAGYVGGRWPTFPMLAARFPHAVRVSIAVVASEDAQVLDVETGDATPDQAPGWARRQRTRGQDPTVYCNTSTWPAVVAAFRAEGESRPHWWRADYNGRALLEMGEVAHQYRSDTAADLDYSVVADYWPGVDPVPQPVPAPAYGPVEDSMDVQEATVTVQIRNGRGWCPAPFPRIVGQPLAVDLDPAVVGTYAHVPTCEGITSDGKLVFGPGAEGLPVDGDYGFVIWGIPG